MKYDYPPLPLLPLPFPNISLQNVSLAMYRRNDSALIFWKTSARNQIGGSCDEKMPGLSSASIPGWTFKPISPYTADPACCWQRGLLGKGPGLQEGSFPADGGWATSTGPALVFLCSPPTTSLVSEVVPQSVGTRIWDVDFPSYLLGCKISFLPFIIYCLRGEI